MFRTTVASSSRVILSSSCRTFHTTRIAAQIIPQKAKDVANDVNLKVGKKLAGAIETGEKITETTKDTLGGSSATEVADKVNKAVGRGVASSIEKGEQATEATKETLGSATAKSKETADIAGQKANQAAAGAREGKEDLKADVKKQLRK